MVSRKSSFRIVFAPGARPSWLQRTLAMVLVATLAVLGFFFLTVALALGASLAVVILVRLWWLRRKLRATSRTATYEGDYVVIEHLPQTPGDSPAPDDRARVGPS